MSMFNDIVWKKNVENCISNAEEVRNYAIKFMTGHRTFLGPGSEEKWYGDSYGEKRTVDFARSTTTWRQRTSSQETSRTGSFSCQC